MSAAGCGSTFRTCVQVYMEIYLLHASPLHLIVFLFIEKVKPHGSEFALERGVVHMHPFADLARSMNIINLLERAAAASCPSVPTH